MIRSWLGASGCCEADRLASPARRDDQRRLGLLDDGRAFEAVSDGETLTLEYWTTYHYHGYPQTDEECQYRRAVMRRLENFDMRVEFHPSRVPAAIWWAAWDGMEGGVIEQEEAVLDGQHSVHRYLRFIEKTVAGFYWRW